MSDKTAERDSLVRAYTDEYYRIRREQLRFIIENKASLAAVYALYQRLPGDTYLFNGDSDVVYYRTVAEAIADRYPTSPYVQSLQAEVERMDARIDLMSRVTERGYPDLELTDMYGKQVRLSSLAGKVVLLDFWSAEAGTGNALNADLKEIYREICRPWIRGLSGGCRYLQTAVDHGCAGTAAAVDLGKRPARQRIGGTPPLQRAAPARQLPHRPGRKHRGQGSLRQQPGGETR